MTVDLLPIINIEGKSLRVSDKIDFSEKNEIDFRFAEPASVDAVFTVLGGCINLSAKVLCPMEYLCDRCGTAYHDILEFEFEEILKKETPNIDSDDKDSDVIFFIGNTVLMDEIVYKNIFMNLPTKKLCQPYCKGLCPSCGQNLNDGECGCDTRTADPRFDALDKFFEQIMQVTPPARYIILERGV